MSFMVRVLLSERNGGGSETVIGNGVHADVHYEYKTLEQARKAAQVACNAAAALSPARSKAASDEDWTEHPDRSDAADV